MKKSPDSHWLDRAHAILSAHTGDLRRLAESAEADPAQFYTHQSLASCDLRGQDLRGFDLTGCEIDRAVIDDSTKLDAKFDPRLLSDEEHLSFSIPRSLNKLVLDYSADVGYVYDAWAYKSLIERGLYARRRGHWRYYEKLVKTNPYFSELVDYRSRSSLVHKTIQVYAWQKLYIEENFDNFMLDEAIGWIMLIGALATRIRHNSRKDYASLPPNALFPQRRIGAALYELGHS